MKSHVHATQPVGECRWAVPACRASLMSDDGDTFENYWQCERTSVALPVTQADCGACPYWSPEMASVNARKH